MDCPENIERARIWQLITVEPPYPDLWFVVDRDDWCCSMKVSYGEVVEQLSCTRKSRTAPCPIEESTAITEFAKLGRQAFDTELTQQELSVVCRTDVAECNIDVTFAETTRCPSDFPAVVENDCCCCPTPWILYLTVPTNSGPAYAVLIYDTGSLSWKGLAVIAWDVADFSNDDSTPGDNTFTAPGTCGALVECHGPGGAAAQATGGFAGGGGGGGGFGSGPVLLQNGVSYGYHVGALNSETDTTFASPGPTFPFGEAGRNAVNRFGGAPGAGGGDTVFYGGAGHSGTSTPGGGGGGAGSAGDGGNGNGGAAPGGPGSSPGGAGGPHGVAGGAGSNGTGPGGGGGGGSLPSAFGGNGADGSIRISGPVPIPVDIELSCHDDGWRLVVNGADPGFCNLQPGSLCCGDCLNLIFSVDDGVFTPDGGPGFGYVTSCRLQIQSVFS